MNLDLRNFPLSRLVRTAETRASATGGVPCHRGTIRATRNLLSLAGKLPAPARVLVAVCDMRAAVFAISPPPVAQTPGALSQLLHR
jgi:hypothetical protein